ncbi:MAG: Rieske (2Fe-2S) protein [Verrucomicrobia bacterium]|nr:Rieske (2Fe-2S) protein [Verrucomicrobiota bacterium]
MKQNLNLERRRFIKTFAFATAYSALLGKTWTDTLASEIRTLSVSTTGTLRLKLSSFPALQNESGSVRLALNPLRADLMPDGQFYPVIINRGPNNTFFALNSRCTHQQCTVDPMNAFTNQMLCQCHGSIFGIDGRRISGLASGALSKYTIQFDGSDLLQVQIPSLGYSITGSNVQPAGGGNPRFRLDFRALRKVEYEVLYRESLDKEAAPASFSPTADGAADQTTFSSATTANVSLFVERKSSAGFYMIAVRVSEI